MKYLVAQDWDSTHGNHAGVVHLCYLLKEKYPNEYRVFVKDVPSTPTRPQKANIFCRIKAYFNRKAYESMFKKEYFELCKPMFKELKPGDEVYLLEYHLPNVNQYTLALYLKRHYSFVKLYALSHMTGLWFDRMRNSKQMILEWEKPIDKQLTLGSSLTDYFIKVGVEASKLSTGFYYVDLNYYKNEPLKPQQRLKIVSIGALLRDFTLLEGIVRACPQVDWIICRGRKNIDDMFKGLDNVKLLGYMEEDDLKHYMSIADLSLNVMEDTVGSNVITSSLAMGNGIIVSDVGSIHDYCDKENAVFCDNTIHSFVDAINELAKTPERVYNMKLASKKKALLFDVERIHEWFNSL